MDILSVLRELAPRLTLESCEKALPFLAQLLSSNSDMNSRSLICQVLYALSASNAAFSLVVYYFSKKLCCDYIVPSWFKFSFSKVFFS